MNKSQQRSHIHKSKNRSQPKLQKNYIKLSSSNTSPNKIININQNNIVNQIKKIRSKICSVLDTYILMYQNNSPLRCLQHNSVLSLYCQTQKKLICANCIFRKDTHKLHKVLPIDKCYQEIICDIQQKSKLIQKQGVMVSQLINSMVENAKNQQKYVSEALSTLTQLYEQTQLALINSFRQAKNKILASIQQTMLKKSPLVVELEYFKDILLRHRPEKFYNLDQLKKDDAGKMEKQLIFQHLIRYALCQCWKMEGGKMMDGGSKVKSIEKKQIQKIKRFKNTIDQESCNRCGEFHQK